MKTFIKTILLLLLPAATLAQDTALTITSSMFNKNGQCFISGENGWHFKQGNDTAWAKKDIDASRWLKLAPVDMSEKYLDKNGRVEGWFRLKIKTDASLGTLFGIKSASWAATDIYVDGHLVVSNGNTGANGKPYFAGTTNGHLAEPFNLSPGAEHVIAMHFLDFVTATPPIELKSNYAQLASIISITKPGYNANYFKSFGKAETFDNIWVSVGIVLSLLFWLLWIQNPSEKNLRLIAIGSTLLTASTLSGVLNEGVGVSYDQFIVYTWFNNVFTAGASMLDLLILISVFKRKVTLALKIFLVIFMIFPLIESFLQPDIETWVTNLMIIIQTCLSIYYIVSAWKNLRGPQWAIVVGVIISLVMSGTSTFIWSYINTSLEVTEIFDTVYSLSFPLALLVYVSMRFKEIMAEVRENAAQVVQLSEEKKEEALNRQKVLQEEVDRQTAEIRTTLDNLKATQTQLIQSEKMASLGELTAGIAHEIQNPLNFVNNFSEVSVELLEELKEEAEAGNKDDVIAIADDLTANLQKINHHGKRADFIVKGMLQHSRTSTGEKQPTDLNVLCDEFLKLSYHGLRAKDKNFNAEMVTHFDPNLPKLNVSQQDIGRVMLNLFNNAFYAVNQKKKTAGPDYKPEVSVSTSTENGQVIIRIKDNGTGISDAIKEKIMQPFFTTKPTGEGTGLGLSLTYDMVVKGHGGKIEVETEPSVYTEFIVTLPIS